MVWRRVVLYTDTIFSETYIASDFGIEFLMLRAASVAKTLQSLNRIIVYNQYSETTNGYCIS